MRREAPPKFGAASLPCRLSVSSAMSIKRRGSMTYKTSHPFPTASHKGDTIPLALRVGDEVVKGRTVKEFFFNVLSHIDERGLMRKLALPFATSGENNLVARDPQHPDGRPFLAVEIFRPSEGKAIYINVNHPRFFALRQGARLLESVGLKAVPVQG